MNTTPVVGIDPGSTQSGYIVWDGAAKEILEKGIVENAELILRLRRYPYVYPMGLEMVQNFGNPMSNDVLETVVYTGRLIECWMNKGAAVVQYKRSQIKAILCRDSKAKDSWVRQRLIDLHGPIGRKKEPGPLYGVKEHEWQSLAVAVVAWDELYASTKG